MRERVRKAVRRMGWLSLYPYRSYSHRHKAIFIHIPKNAGTSVLKMLGHKGPRDHAPWSAFNGADAGCYGEYYKFTFVRNPWMRLVSSYNYICGGGNLSEEDIWLKRHVCEKVHNFDQFVLNFLDESKIWRYPLLRPQWYYVINQRKEIMVDFVGRVENFDTDFKHVADYLGLANNDLIKTNTSKSLVNDDYFSNEAIVAKIKYLYELDCDLFGYAGPQYK